MFDNQIVKISLLGLKMSLILTASVSCGQQASSGADPGPLIFGKTDFVTFISKVPSLRKKELDQMLGDATKVYDADGIESWQYKIGKDVNFVIDYAATGGGLPKTAPANMTIYFDGTTKLKSVLQRMSLPDAKLSSSSIPKCITIVDPRIKLYDITWVPVGARYSNGAKITMFSDFAAIKVEAQCYKG